MSEQVIKTKLNEILNLMEISPNVEVVEEDETFKITIEGDDLSFLIGYRGESLNALQTLLGMMIFNESDEWAHIILDINGYRDSRQDKIEDMTKNFIDRVRFHKADVEMPSMNSYERRQVHLFVEEYPDVISESTGEGRARRVVLKLKENS